MVADSGGGLYAWCLMPNHVHALLRTGTMPLGRLVQRWVGPYATAFNREYGRVGHLFQNRFKSIVVDEERYLLELVRYIHLNPVRARLPVSVDDLDSYPWTGHAVLLGRRSCAAQDTDFVLAHFGTTVGAARHAYRQFVHAGVRDCNNLDLSGGGLRRSAAAWRWLPDVRRGREAWAHDERILGDGAFVETVLGQCSSVPSSRADPATAVALLSQRVADRFAVTAAQIASPSLRRHVLNARAVVCHLAVCRLGLTLPAVGAALGLSKQSVKRAVDRAPRLLAQVEPVDDLLP